MPCRGRQRKTWGRVVDDLFAALGIDKGEYLHDVEGAIYSSVSFMAIVLRNKLVRGNVSCMMRDLIVKS